MAKRVLMLLANPYKPDPRVQTEAQSLSDHGYRVRLIAWERKGKHPRREVDGGIEVTRVHVASTYGRGATQVFKILLFWLAAMRISCRVKFDVIHCHDFDTLPAGYVMSRLRRKPLIYDSHESYPNFIKSLVPHLLWWLIYKLEGFLVRRVDYVIAAGENIKANLMERGAREVEVIGNWKRLDQFRVEEGEIDKLAQKFSLASKLVLGYVGALVRGRCVPELIEAVKRQPNVALIVAGDGELSERIAALCQESQNTIFLGYVPFAEVPHLTAVSDCVCYPADPSYPINYFGPANKLFEAMAGGRAILATNIGELAQIVREENCGVLVDSPTAEAMEKAIEKLKEKRFLEQLKKNALLAAQRKYNWHRGEEKLLALYEHLFKEGRPG